MIIIIDSLDNLSGASGGRRSERSQRSCARASIGTALLSQKSIRESMTRQTIAWLNKWDTL